MDGVVPDSQGEKLEVRWEDPSPEFVSNAYTLVVTSCVGGGFVLVALGDDQSGLLTKAIGIAFFGALISLFAVWTVRSRPHRVIERKVQVSKDQQTLSSLQRLTELRRYTQLEDSAAALLRAQPDNVDALIYLAIAVGQRPAQPGSVEQKANAAEAIKHLDRALQLRPDHPEALRHRANAHQVRRDYNKSFRDIRRAESLSAASHVLFDHAQILRQYAFEQPGLRTIRQRHRKKAERKLLQLLGRHPNHHEAIALLALVQSEGGQHELAVETASRALAITPDSHAMYFLGRSKLKLGKFDEGAEAIMAAAQLDPTLIPYIQRSFSMENHIPAMPTMPAGLAVILAMGLVIEEELLLASCLAAAGLALFGLAYAITKKRYERLPDALRQKIEA